MRQIKYRQWLGDSFTYWGFIENNGFLGFNSPTQQINTTIEDWQKNSQQFTGLTDRNGVEIYEGDILQSPNHLISKYVVKWDKDKAGFFVHAHNLAKGKSFRKSLQSQNARLREVIGNIYENKDLLNEK